MQGDLTLFDKRYRRVSLLENCECDVMTIGYQYAHYVRNNLLLNSRYNIDGYLRLRLFKDKKMLLKADQFIELERVDELFQ